MRSVTVGRFDVEVMAVGHWPLNDHRQFSVKAGCILGDINFQKRRFVASGHFKCLKLVAIVEVQ